MEISGINETSALRYVPKGEELGKENVVEV